MNGLLALVLMAICVSVYAQVELSCPSPKWDLNRRTDRCYWFNHEDSMASYQADEHCRRWNGRLVTVNDMIENDYIFGKFPADADFAYIGLNDKGVEGEYKWFDGDIPLDWAGNWPTDYFNDGRLDCVVMKTGASGDGTWLEVQCNDAFPFICEAPAGVYK